MSARSLFLLSGILRHVNRPFGNLASSYRVFGHGESPAMFINSDGIQDFHLSSLASSKIPDPPKRPMPVFMAYVAKRRHDLLKVQPDLKHFEVVKQIAVDWRAMSFDEKQDYINRNELERAEFKTLKEKWWNNLTSEQKEDYKNSKQEIKRIKEQRALKKTLRILGKPKKPGSSYCCFVSQIDKNLLKPGQTVLQYAQQAWKSVSGADKELLDDMYRTKNERYKKDMLAWRQKMMDEGNEDIVRRISKVEKHVEAKGQKSDLKKKSPS